jgi:ppGpp synthetase/RelA/SpoT-type nucleotidyltranferase
MSNPLTDPAAAASLSPEAWVALHVPRFAAVAPAYTEYETFLKTALKRLANRVAPLAVVEARAKGLPSFAEKILRKRTTYQTPADPQVPDPLVRITDLCGGRVICQTAAQVQAVCKLIEKAFIIDWANSEDVSQRLKPAEFGYRSVHYIVQVDPARLAAAGLTLEVPPVLLGLPADPVGDKAAGIPLKAEVQVRTFLEHASSMLGHDTIYKTELKMPQRIQRHYAALAAVLEGADRETSRLLEDLGDFHSNAGAWLGEARIREEIAYARVMLGLADEHLPGAAKVPVAVRAAKLAVALGDPTQAVEILRPFAAQADAGVQGALGQALTSLHWDRSGDEGFAAGEDALRRATELRPGDAETWCLRAECAAHTDDDENARLWFGRALSADGTEPRTLAHYLEFEAARQASDMPLLLSAPMIRAAIARARCQIEANANLDTAWSTLVLFHLYLGEPFASLHALAQLLRLCGGGKPADASGPAQPCSAGRALLRLRGSIRRLGGLRKDLAGFAWVERFLLLALACRVRDPRSARELAALASWRTPAKGAGHPHFSTARKAVFISGGCTPDLDPIMASFGGLLERSVRDLDFDLICGGTGAGISGAAGRAAAAGGGSIKAFGYLPASMPRGVAEDVVRYPHRFNSPDTGDFTPMDPLQAWTDLVAAGVSPAEVRLLCYAPGDIARAECAIALGLGARVGVVQDPVLPKERTFDHTVWAGCNQLLSLPMDAMTVRAFLQVAQKPLTPADKTRLERAARRAHEEYTQSAKPKDPSLFPWEKLHDDLKNSNYYQVAYWEHTLQDYGLGIRPLTDADLLHPALEMARVLPKRAGVDDPVLELAELEHGRWNVERLSYGWAYAPDKDVTRKLSPYLIPWAALPKDIQAFDIDAITKLPVKLREVGLEVYRLTT